MAKPKNRATRTYVCQGRLNRSTNAHGVLRERRVAAGVLFDAALDRLAEKYTDEVLGGNDAQLLATAIAQGLGMQRGQLNSRCRIAVTGRAVNAHNARVKHGAGMPAEYGGGPVRTIETYAHSNRLEKPLVTVNADGRATLRFPGLPPIRLLSCRPLPDDQPTYASVTADGRRIRVSPVYRVEQEPLPADGQWDPHDVLGLDLGIIELIAGLAGISCEGISQREFQDRIRTARRLKQAMVRKAVRAGLAGYQAVLDDHNKQVLSPKGTPRRYLHWTDGKSAREYRKAAQGLSRLLGQRAQQRRHYRHQVAAQIVRHCANNGISLIAFEKLNIPNMTKSAQGTAGNPGRPVAQKRGLNRRILEQGWAELVRYIRYKARRLGMRTVPVNAAGTSQTCSECGHRDRRSRRGKRFECVNCTHRGDADANAALNIGDRGTRTHLRREGASLDDVRRRRVAAADGRSPSPQAPATGTDEVPAVRRDPPRAEPVYTPAQLANSSQLALW